MEGIPQANVFPKLHPTAREQETHCCVVVMSLNKSLSASGAPCLNYPVYDIFLIPTQMDIIRQFLI